MLRAKKNLNYFMNVFENVCSEETIIAIVSVLS